MDKAPAFQFYPSDWLDVKVLRMSLAAQGAYIRWLCHMWRDSSDQCSIENSASVLARLVGISDEECKGILREIQWQNDPIFDEKDGRLVSRRLQRIRKEQDAFRRAKSDAGKNGNAKRWHSDRTAIDLRVAKDRSSSSPSSSSSSSSSLKEAIPDGEALKAAVRKAELFEKPDTQHKVKEYIGYLENVKTIPNFRILEWVNSLWALRESLVMSDGIPTDRIFCYAIDQAMENKATRPSYVGKVIQNAVIKWREGALKL